MVKYNSSYSGGGSRRIEDQDHSQAKGERPHMKDN
jgi:hypothetical protein